MFLLVLILIFVTNSWTTQYESFKMHKSLFPDYILQKSLPNDIHSNFTNCLNRLKRDSSTSYASKIYINEDTRYSFNNRRSFMKRHKTYDPNEKHHTNMLNNPLLKSTPKMVQRDFTNHKNDMHSANIGKEQITYENTKPSKSGNKFKLTIGTIKLSKLRLPRKPSKIKNKIITSHLFNNATTLKLFQGVSTDEEKVLNFLISHDIQTGIMEFVELAYESNKNKFSNREFTNSNNNLVDDKYENKCGYKFGYDLEKLINLNGVFSVQINKALSFVNILNTILTTKKFNYDGIYEKLLKSFLFSDGKILATGITFESTHNNEKGNSNPYIIKTDNKKTNYIVEYERTIRDPDNDLFGYNNYRHFNINKPFTKRQTFLQSDDNKGHERMLKNYSWKLQQYKDVCMHEYNGMTITTLKNESLWGHMHSDCTIRKVRSYNRVQKHSSFEDSNVKGIWSVPYFLPFFGCNAQNTVAFKGILKIVLDLTMLEFNQCENNNKTFLFHVQHNCPPTTQCQHMKGGGFRMGNYKCVCPDIKPFWTESKNITSGILSKNNNDNISSDTLIDTQNVISLKNDNSSKVSCFWMGKILEICNTDQILNRSKIVNTNALNKNNCTGCAMHFDSFGCPDLNIYEKLESQQLLQQQQWSEDYNYWMKGLPFGIQCFTILTGLAIAVNVARLKRNKVMKISIWVLLEFSVIGALVLHFSVILAYFEATPIICLLIPWCREIGFLFLYGSLLLKHQRTLTEFQSRKAHRVQWRDKDLVRCLIVMVSILIFNMAAWTASVSDNLSTIDELTTDIRIELKTSLSSFPVLVNTCQLSLKDRILEAGELAFLGYVVYMCYKVRKAPNEYHENKYITFCVINEILISVLYYSFRYFFNSVWHPDRMFLASFLRCHVTSTVAVVLVVCSKLWYSCWPPTAEYRARSCSSAPSVDSRSVQFLNPSSPPPASPPIQFDPTKSDSINLDETDISQMTSDDIRYELRKLYTQLQIYKTKTMRQDNPHISKRRGGKKQTNRKFSFQNLHAKYKQQSSVTSANAAATTPSGSVGGGTSMGGDHCENSTVTAGGEIDLSVRSPEDSSNSMEGVSVYMDENSYASPDVNASAGKDSYAVKKQQNAFKSILSGARNKSKQTN